MASASVVVSALKDLNKSQEVDRYNEGLCRDIQQRLDSKLSDLSISDKALFARNNFVVMDKWKQVFPTGISECLSEYFRKRSQFAPGFDPRFPNTNQAKNCFVNYVDYQRCLKLKGSENRDCDYFKQAANALCPQQWIEKFEEQVEQDAFPAST